MRFLFYNFRYKKHAYENHIVIYDMIVLYSGVEPRFLFKKWFLFNFKIYEISKRKACDYHGNYICLHTLCFIFICLRYVSKKPWLFIEHFTADKVIFKFLYYFFKPHHLG